MLAASLALSAALGAAHPSLFFQGGDVDALRAAAGSTHQAIASHLTQILDQHVGDPVPTPSDYDDPRFFGQDVCAWAFGYQLTGKTSYADQAKLRLQTYLTWTDWGFGEIQSLGAPDLNIGHFLIGVSCAYDLLYGYLSDADRAAIAARLGDEANRMFQSWSGAWYVDQYPQNHNWINSAGMGLAGLALQGEDSRAGSWLSAAQSNLAKVSLALRGISDGSWHEGILYEEYGISTSLPFWMAMRAIGSDYTDLGILRGLGRMFLVAQIPDAPRQQILLHGDFTGWPSSGMVAMLRFTAGRFGDGLAETAARRWLDAGARSHLLPDMFFEVFEFLAYDPTVAATDAWSLPLDNYLPDLQASVLHSSWDKGDLALAFKAGPYGGRANFDRMKVNGAPGGHLNWGHDHNDDMSFWLWGNGRWLAPEAAGYDAGTNTGYTPSKRANMTAFHNGLLVDGTGQLGDTRGSDDEIANPWFFGRDAQPLLLPAGTADYAVAGGRGASLYPASLGLSRWDRVVVLARKRYALVRDDVAASSAHAYEWVCHFLDGANVDTASGWVQGIARSDVSLGVRVVSPASWTATTGTQSANLTFLFEPDSSISYVRVRPSDTSQAVQFLTALVPMPATAWSSRVQIDPLADGDRGAGAVIAPGSKLEERWIFGSPDAPEKAAGDLTLAGSLVGMSALSSGAPTRALLVGQGSLLDQSGSRLLLATRSARVIEADVQGTTLVVTGDGIADFQAYAPGVTAAKINGQAVAASRTGDVIEYPGTPPTVTIDSAPPALTNQRSVSFAFSSNREGTFSCVLDAGDARPCASGETYTAPSEGPHSFSVTATDTMGNFSAPASSAWTVDTTPPVATILSAPRSPSNSTSATFGLSSDDAGATLSCTLDGSPAAVCTTNASFAGLADGTHTLTLTARDAAGNVSAPASFTWTIDTTPPIASIGAGPAPLTKETSATFALSSNEASATFSCKLDAREPAPCSSSVTYVALAAGTHAFGATAIDRAGNASATTSFTWTIDTSPPGAAIASGPAARTNQTTATFSFTSAKPGAAWFCRLDAAPELSCSNPATISNVADGNHTFAVRAVDALGNADQIPATYAWTVDTIPPLASITAGPAALTKEASATFAFASNDASATFSCKLDAREPAPCSSPVSYAALAAGTHAFSVAAIDAAGNVSATSSFTWTIDTAAPGAAIASGPAARTNQTTATFSFTSPKRGAAWFCNLDGAPEFSSCSNPTTVSSLADGNHTFAVRAVDELGNADQFPATYSWTVDTVHPSTAITSRPPAVTDETTATFTFASSKPDATFACQLDAADFASCATPLLLTGLEKGDHSLRVRSGDALGNVDPAPASYRWTVAAHPQAPRGGGCSSTGASITPIVGWILATLLARARDRSRRVRNCELPRLSKTA